MIKNYLKSEIKFITYFSLLMLILNVQEAYATVKVKLPGSTPSWVGLPVLLFGLYQIVNGFRYDSERARGSGFIAILSGLVLLFYK